VRHGPLGLLPVLLLLNTKTGRHDSDGELEELLLSGCLWRGNHLTDDVLHLLSVEDVRGVDDTRVAGPVQLSGVLILTLKNRTHPSAPGQNHN